MKMRCFICGATTGLRVYETRRSTDGKLRPVSWLCEGACRAGAAGRYARRYVHHRTPTGRKKKQ